MEQIALESSKQLSKSLKKPVMVEDTGVFFKAYKGFPGPMPKFIYEKIGYDGIFRLLKAKNRNARFVSAVGFCFPGKKPVVFTGEMKGRITNTVRCRKKDVLPYERIFVPEKCSKVLAELPKQEKIKMLHRYKAFIKLKSYLER